MECTAPSVFGPVSNEESEGPPNSTVKGRRPRLIRQVSPFRFSRGPTHCALVPPPISCTLQWLTILLAGGFVSGPLMSPVQRRPKYGSSNRPLLLSFFSPKDDTSLLSFLWTSPFSVQ